MLRANPAEFDPRRPVHRAWEPITESRAALWQTELTAWQVAAIEAAVADEMDEFGYERRTSGATNPSMLRARLEALTEMGFQKLFRFPCAFYRFFQPTNLADEQKWIARASVMYGRVRLPRAAGAP